MGFKVIAKQGSLKLSLKQFTLSDVNVSYVKTVYLDNVPICASAAKKHGNFLFGDSISNLLSFPGSLMNDTHSFVTLYRIFLHCKPEKNTAIKKEPVALC